MINLTTLFNSLGIVSGNINAKNQYDFYYGIVWSDGDTTYNQYEFYQKLGGRYEFFKQYIDEYNFYQMIDDPRIYDYKTFYEFAGEYLVSSGLDWILETGNWNDANFWIDTEQWIDAP
jgi:hypothetical protein